MEGRGAVRGVFARLAPLCAAAVVVLLITQASAPPAPATAAGGNRWAWPVEPAVLVRGYEAPASRYAPGHRGIDLAADVTAPVVAPDDGVVRFAGRVVDRPVVSIDHGDGIVSSFEPVTPEVVEGQRVSRGQRIGVIASDAHCTAVGDWARANGGCLHLGARHHGEYFSPLVMLGGIPRAVLLPVV